MTGSMEPYLKKLRHYAGDVPLLSGDYGSSEAWIGANINPELPPELATYIVLPHIGYFEFTLMKENAREDRQDKIQSLSPPVESQPVGLTEVKIDEQYEIVVTIFAGLYRYKLGDVVKVAGFHNTTPELQFVCRRNLLLSINIDKNTEKDLQQAVEAAAKILAPEKAEVVDFTSQADKSTDPGHYVIFWEISGEVSNEVSSECCNCLDLMKNINETNRFSSPYPKSLFIIVSPTKPSLTKSRMKPQLKGSFLFHSTNAMTIKVSY